MPALSEKAIITLLHNAGIVAGIGDSRQEKGKGGFGVFRVGTDPDEIADLLDLNAQLAAIENPQPANVETAELLAEFDGEVQARKAT